MSNVTLNKKNVTPAVELDDVYCGDCFLYKNNLYMKVDLGDDFDEELQGCSVNFGHDNCEKGRVATIALADGDLYVFGCSVVVMPLEEVVINY